MSTNDLGALVELGRRLWAAAEGGFQEWETHRILSDAFVGAGFALTPFEGIPGFVAQTGPKSAAVKRRDPTEPPPAERIALISDMDALPLPDGGYRHMCGHHQQMVALFSTAVALRDADPAAAARVAFVACPAEEFVELDRRAELRREGVIEELSGKLELLRRGVFEGYTAVVATHSASLPPRRNVGSVRLMNGFEELRFEFRGVSAHAGAAPHRGRNAQNAAALFLQACAFWREAFDEDEHIRIHPVLRISPQQLVSFVPDSVGAETYVRAATPAAVARTCSALREAAEGCARALEVQTNVHQRRGYAPFLADDRLHAAAEQCAAALGIRFKDEQFGAASSDVGDISQVMPTVMIGLPGTNARFHHPDFAVVDESLAYEFPSTFLVPYLQTILTDIYPTGEA